MQFSFDLSGVLPLAEARTCLPHRPEPRRVEEWGPSVSPVVKITAPPDQKPPISNAATLKAEIANLERGNSRTDWGALPFGHLGVDSCLPYRGLQLGHWHEIIGDGKERETPAAVTGFTSALLQRVQRGGAIVWVCRRDDLHAPGLQALGICTDSLILVRVDKDDDVLSVQEDALRTRGVTAAIGEVDKIDLVAGRRLQLVCEKSGATGFVVRRKLFGTQAGQAHILAPAAATRWRIAAAASEKQTPGLGAPRWSVRLDRCRGGRTGAWIMEMQNAASGQKSPLRVVAELADHALATDHEPAKSRWLGHFDHDRQRAASGGG